MGERCDIELSTPSSFSFSSNGICESAFTGESDDLVVSDIFLN